jgi:hypothetical protein
VDAVVSVVLGAHRQGVLPVDRMDDEMHWAPPDQPLCVGQGRA